MDTSKSSRAGKLTNPPQHILDNGTGIAEGLPSGETAKEGAHRQTGVGTAPADLDVSDPHPSDEEHPYRERHPGGANPPTTDIGPNPAAHDGEPARRPRNAGSGPE
jgi:hypothetical protein